MPDLSSQIETLYRVIGQLRPEGEPENEPGRRRDSRVERKAAQPAAVPIHRGSNRPTSRTASVRWNFTFYCLWFSLPLSVWSSSGWIGLLFYWRVLSGATRLMELAGLFVDVFSRRPSLAANSWRSRRRRAFQPRPLAFQPGLQALQPGPCAFQSRNGGARCSAIEAQVR